LNDERKSALCASPPTEEVTMARKGQTRASNKPGASGSAPPQQAMMNWPKQTLKQLGNALTTAGTHFNTLAQSGGGRGGARTGTKTGGAGRAIAKSRSNPTS
jgi:hypothetical protein